MGKNRGISRRASSFAATRGDCQDAEIVKDDNEKERFGAIESATGTLKPFTATVRLAKRQ